MSSKSIILIIPGVLLGVGEGLTAASKVPAAVVQAYCGVLWRTVQGEVELSVQGEA